MKSIFRCTFFLIVAGTVITAAELFRGGVLCFIPNRSVRDCKIKAGGLSEDICTVISLVCAALSVPGMYLFLLLEKLIQAKKEGAVARQGGDDA